MVRYRFSQGLRFIHPKRILMILMIMSVLLCPLVRAEGRDLSDILQTVEKYAPALQAALSGAKAREAKARETKSRYFGEVDAVAQDSHFNDGRLVNPISFPPDITKSAFDDNQIGTGLVATLPLDINRRIGHDLEAADNSATASHAVAQDVRLRLLHAAARYYHDIERVAGQKRALQKQAEALTGHIRVATVAIKVGRIPEVERLRLVAELQTVKSRIAALDGSEQAFRARLAALMGRGPFQDTVAPSKGQPPGIPPDLDPVKKRPDIEASKSRLKASEAGTRAAQAARWPTLSLNTAWLYNKGYSEDGDDTWQLFLRLNLPLWDGGRRRAAIGRAHAQQAASEQSLSALQDQARAEFSAALAGWHAAIARYDATISAVKAAEEAARIQGDRFAVGRLSATDLVDAEATLAEVRSTLATALTDWWQARDDVMLATGSTPSAYKSGNTSR